MPAPLTPLIGRDGRVDAAWHALQGTRLLTLTGPGGSGKTRLAVELASRAESAAWVELATLADPRFLADHVATELGVPDRAGKPSLTHIIERFSSTPMLLVLDNCEHVVDAVTGFLSRLLRDCPAMKVLSTSREALGVTGERTVGVPPLSVPRDDSIESAREADAIALFVERAQDVRAGFALTARNVAAIARICRRLDGIPLAIELAAARVRALDPEQLAGRLESSIGLLETGSRAALPRHRTIRDTIDWSYELLAEGERRLLRRLSVFHGTFSLEAVEGVCALRDPQGVPSVSKDAESGAGSASELDTITALLDKSLLFCDAGDDGIRYRLLQTVREYAAERLQDAGETDAIRERHARFFLALAERAAPSIMFAGDADWLARLDDEWANLREAHDWCEQQSSRLEMALRMAVALHWYWYARGRFNEGRLRLGIALTFAEHVSPLLRGRALTALGRLAGWQGDFASVQAPASEAVTLLRPLGDRDALAYALLGTAVAASLQGRFGDARRILDEAADTQSDESDALGASIEYWKGLVAQWDGDATAARHAFEASLAIGRRLARPPLIAHAQCALGRLLAEQQERDAATSALRESLLLFRDTDDRWGLARALQGLARVAASAGGGGRAAALLGASDGIRADLSIELSPPDRGYHDATIAAALSHMGEPAFWCTWAEGRARSLSEIIASVLSERAPTEAARPTRSQAATADLRIRALGGFEAYVKDRRVEKNEWGSCRARELLAFLACYPDGCTKTQIGLALWPDASPGQLRNTFHVTLHRLRHALALPDAIQVENDRYRLNTSLVREFDAESFEQEVRSATRDLRHGADATDTLGNAVARYRGDFLAGEPVGEWACQRRDRLHLLHLESLEVLGRAQMERGRFTDAADVFRALLAVDPVNEDACRRQMICLNQIGDRAGALRAYDALVRALKDELGVKPERETTMLREKLSSGSVVSGSGSPPAL